MRRAALALALAGCGYRPVNEARDAAGPFVVITGEATSADAAVMAAVEAGARAELSRAHALAPGGEGTALAIERVRVDERSEGVALDPGAQRPVARGIRIEVAGEAVVRGAAPRSTGLVDEVEVVARAASAPAAIAERDEAARRAGYRLGEKLVRRILGGPEPSEP